MGAHNSKISKKISKSQEIHFSVNGVPHSIKESDKINPETSLNTYLRYNAGLRDTKSMCHEGGCGACVVAVTLYHPIFKHKKTISVNSCLVPILICHNWEIETVRGIGNKQNGYHKIQDTLAKFGGSQCGYCSGGMVMNMYALLQSNDQLKMQDVENAFSGNLCRCTGYRPIMDAFKSLTTDVDPCLVNKYPDIEDIKICSKSNKTCNGICSDKKLDPICIRFDDGYNWFKVFNLDQIFQLFKIIGNEPYSLVAGNTGKGVFPVKESPKYWIDINNVKELNCFNVEGNKLKIGACLSLANIKEIFDTVATENEDFWFLHDVSNHIDLIANVPVRNVATIGGNLILKHKYHKFSSDIFLLFETINAQISLVQPNNIETKKTLSDFLNFNINKCVIKEIIIPMYNKDVHLFKTYKIMPRAQNSYSYVNAGFLIEHNESFEVKSAKIVYGGINPEFIHATNTEQFLINKNLFDNETIQGALKTLTEELKPNYVLPDASPEFRKNLAKNLFYKFLLATAPKDKLNSNYISGGSKLERGLSKGTQFYQTNEGMYPVTKPVTKLEAIQQTSGEAQYIDDMPSIPNEVFGAFVLTETVPLSKIVKIDTSEALNLPGVIAFIDHKDIPGKNAFASPPLNFFEEELFCSGKVLYNGQPVGLIVANSFAIAQYAAGFVKITYEKTDLKPMFDIKTVLKNEDGKRITKFYKQEASKKGDNVKFVVKGETTFKGQYHFTMETQTSVCVPTDDEGYDLFAGTQWVHVAQNAAANALNLPMSKINVFVKRLGGAYGAKILRSSMVSTACAVASHKLQLPVRIVLPLKDNMKMIGKRFPTYANYEAGVDENGCIQYLNVDYYQGSGTSHDNEQLVILMHHYMQSCYRNDTWKMNGNLVWTDMAGNCFTRAPGSSEAIAIIETIMEHIAQVTGKSSIEVRYENMLHDEDNMPTFVKDTLSWAEYNKRRKLVDEYNKNNRWMKKGLNVSLMNYHLVKFGPFSVFLSIFAPDGTVAVSHGGIESGQGINTKVQQVCAYQLKIPLEMVSIKPTASFTTPNNQMTGASVTSESVCYATIQACNEILRRLEPIKQKMNNPTWKELILEAKQQEIELCATSMCTAENQTPYNIPGACVSEVQVDILTGEHVVTRVDIMEDVGSSISPEIDLGQIEGAFIMGMGHYTCEDLIYDEEGKLLTNNTWTYKVPGVKDIPADFRIKFRVDGTNPAGILNNKACGEPPLCLAISVPLAIRDALKSARKDAESTDNEFIEINGPTTVEFTLQNTLNNYENYKL